MTTPGPAEPRPSRIAFAIWIGLAIWLFAGAWWFYFYSQYDGALTQLPAKFVCIAVTTPDCLAMQKALAASAVPTYHPELFWLGLAAIVIGILQQRSRRSL